MLAIGDILKGKYRITGVIGRGGTSCVYMANDIEMPRKIWAVKEVLRQTTDASGRPIEQRLERETELLARLNHPMIVGIADTLKTKEHIYIVMDYVDGRALDKVVFEEGPQSEQNVKNWMLQVCEALTYLHSQNPPIVYRDMKPGNIMLRDDGYIKLVDLGVAREFKGNVLKDTTQFGTDGYAPPEQYGKSETDSRADIYAMGATMWHLLTGQAPDSIPLPCARDVKANIGEGFADVIIPKCTELNREKRYSTCEELAADLEVYSELTKEYRNRIKSRVAAFAVCVIAAFMFCVAGIACAGVQSHIEQNNYLTQFSMGNFEAAIGIKGGAGDAYVALLKECRTSDDSFTDADFNKVSELMSKNKVALEASGDWRRVNYEMGITTFAYLNASAAATNRLSAESIRRSKVFLDNAGEYSGAYGPSKAYATIARFYDSVIYGSGVDARNSADKNDDYRSFFNEFDSLMADADFKGSNEYLEFRVYAVCADVILNNYQMCIEAGISESELLRFKSRIKECLSLLANRSSLGGVPSELIELLDAFAPNTYTSA